MAYLLVFRQFLLWPVLVSVFRALNWHAQLWSFQAFGKILTTSRYLKYTLIKDALFEHEASQALSFDTAGAFSWPRTLAIFSLALLRAVATACFFMTVFVFFEPSSGQRHSVWWPVGMVAAFVLAWAGRSWVVGRFFLRETQ